MEGCVGYGIQCVGCGVQDVGRQCGTAAFTPLTSGTVRFLPRLLPRPGLSAVRPMLWGTRAGTGGRAGAEPDRMVPAAALPRAGPGPALLTDAAW